MIVDVDSSNDVIQPVFVNWSRFLDEAHEGLDCGTKLPDSASRSRAFRERENRVAGSRAARLFRAAGELDRVEAKWILEKPPAMPAAGETTTLAEHPAVTESVTSIVISRPSRRRASCKLPSGAGAEGVREVRKPRCSLINTLSFTR